jgi:hypothetical protein
MLLIVPTYTRDFSIAAGLLTSVLEYGTDPGAVSMRMLLSSDVEEQSFAEYIAADSRLQPRQCRSLAGLDLGLTTLARTMDHFGEGCESVYEVLRREQQENPTQKGAATTITRRTCAVVGLMSGTLRCSTRLQTELARKKAGCGQYGQYFQFLKKMYAARYFEYESVLVMDADCTLVKPVSLAALFGRFKAVPLVFTQAVNGFKGIGLTAEACMSMLLNSSDGETLVTTHISGMIYDRGRTKSALSNLEALSPLRALRPFVWPWGSLSWVWDKQVVAGLFEHMWQRHGLTVAERYREVTEVSIQLTDTGGRAEWTRARCYCPTLYWDYVLMLQGAQRAGGVERLRQLELEELAWPVLVSPRKGRAAPSPAVALPRAWPQRIHLATPDLLMERYFPRLRDLSIRPASFERSMSLLFIANTTEPFNGWLRMCKEGKLSFFRLLRQTTLLELERSIPAKAAHHPGQPAHSHPLLRWMPPAQSEKLTKILNREGNSVPYGLPMHRPETYLAMAACLVKLCPTLSVHSNEKMHARLPQHLKLAHDNPERCGLFQGT